jgi:hypothetical protein
VERLTEEQLTALKAWGEGLAQVGQEEMQAAGRAIQLLIQEIEALHIEMWHERIDRSPPPAPSLVAVLFGRARRLTHADRSE